MSRIRPRSILDNAETPEIPRPARDIGRKGSRLAPGATTNGARRGVIRHVRRLYFARIALCRCHASASRRRRPGIFMSAAPGPRSSTGSSPVVWAACSCCVSRTPTSSARRPRWSRAFSTACGGSVSTGTKGRRSAARSVRISSRNASTAIGRWRRDSWPRGSRTTATARQLICMRSATRPRRPAAGGNTIARAPR